MGGCPVPVDIQGVKDGGLLHKAWIGYRISCNPRNGETFQDRLRWAVTIQNIQTDLGLQRSAFPTRGIEGDYVFVYSETKQMELDDLNNELWLKEYKKKKAARIQEIVDASMLTEQEKEWVEEYAPQFTTEITHEKENGYVERVVMPNLFDIRRNSQN